MRVVVLCCGLLMIADVEVAWRPTAVVAEESEETGEILEHDPADPEPLPIAIPDDVADEILLTTDAEVISEDDCLHFAEAVEEAVHTGDTFDFLQLIDWDALLETATKTPGGPASPATVANAQGNFIAGFKSELLKHGGLCRVVVDSVENGGDYAFLRVVEHRTHPRVRFRMLLPEGGVTYQDFVLRRFPDGQVRADDVFLFGSGELLSETVQRGFAEVLVAPAPRGVISWVLGGNREAGEQAQYIRLFHEMTAAHRDDRPEQVLKLFEKLPKSRQGDKTCLMLRLQAALKVGETEYLAAIEDFQKAHPHSVGAELLAIDGHLLHKRYADALQSVDNLDKAVGGDPYLLGLRGNIQCLAGDFVAARTLALEAIEADGELAEPFVVLLNVSLAEKKHAETLDMLRNLTERFGYLFGDLAEVEEYKHFAQSDEFEDWQKFQKAWRLEQEALNSDDF